MNCRYRIVVNEARADAARHQIDSLDSVGTWGFGKAFLLVLGLTLMSAVARPTPADSVSIGDLALLVGHWKSSNGAEEVWLPAADRVMTGVFRWPSAGGQHVLELLSISEETSGAVFRFKHFSTEIEAWEDEANRYSITGIDGQCVFMRRISANERVPAGIRYCRNSPETLEFTAVEDGQTWSEAAFRISFRLQENVQDH